MATKLTGWRKEPTLSELKEDFDGAKPIHSKQMVKIQKWDNLRNIEGSEKIKPVKGRSAIQPKLIRRQAEWRYAALSEPFNSADNIFNVSPVTFEDTKGALQNQLLLNWQFRTKLDRVTLVDEAVHHIVDEGTVAGRVGWSRQTEEVIEQAVKNMKNL